MNIVFTLTGTDRVGIVEEITRSLLDLGGNIESSRMARLGGEFAVLMLVSLPDDKGSALEGTIAGLTARGYTITTTPTAQGDTRPYQGRVPFRIVVQGADHEGIVHRIAHSFAARDVNIETMETGNTRAPNSGILLFSMNALVLAPPDLNEQSWRQELENIGHDQHVDITVSKEI